MEPTAKRARADASALDTLATTATDGNPRRQPSFRITGNTAATHIRQQPGTRFPGEQTPYFRDINDPWYEQHGAINPARRPTQRLGALYSDEDHHAVQYPEVQSHSSGHSGRFGMTMGLMSPKSDRSTSSGHRSQAMPMMSPPHHHHQQQMMYLVPPSSASMYGMPMPQGMPAPLNLAHMDMHSPHQRPMTLPIDDAELMSASPKKQRPRAVKVNDDTVAWLKSNFEMKAGCTVPRGLVYRAYVAHMETMLSEPCNAAGFGKVIRSVFKSVTSRRLGSRGSSRYHYDGLRIKPSSAVAMSRLAEDDEEDQLEDSHSHDSRTPAAVSGAGTGSVSVSAPPSATSARPTTADALRMLAHAVDKELTLPSFPPLTRDDLSEDMAVSAEVMQQLARFTATYRSVAEEMLELLRDVKFTRVYALVHSIWESDDMRAVASLAEHPGVCDKVQLWDTILYDTMLHVLVPEVLRPVGANANASITGFADDLHSSVLALSESNTLNLPEGLIHAKKVAAEIFVQIMTRRMALNNLAQAGLKMLQSSTQTEQMRQDLDRVNMDAIRREGLWVTDCEEDFVAVVCDELKSFLDLPRGLSALSHWLDNIVRRVFDAAQRSVDVAEVRQGRSSLTKDASPASHSGQEGEHEAGAAGAAGGAHTSERSAQSAERSARRTRVVHRTARNLLRDWTYYSVQIMRELTIKNAPSFGSFNVLRLLIDEYLYYLVQTRVTHPHKVIVHPEVIVRRQGSSSDSVRTAAAMKQFGGMGGAHGPASAGAASENSASTEWSAPATASPLERPRRIAMPNSAQTSLDEALRRAADEAPPPSAKAQA